MMSAGVVMPVVHIGRQHGRLSNFRLPQVFLGLGNRVRISLVNKNEVAE